MNEQMLAIELAAWKQAVAEFGSPNYHHKEDPIGDAVRVSQESGARWIAMRASVIVECATDPTKPEAATGFRSTRSRDFCLGMRHAADVCEDAAEKRRLRQEALSLESFSAEFQQRESEAADERQRAFARGNGLLRSAYQVADRNGIDTNWYSFRMRLHEALVEQHQIMYPDQQFSAA